jgi:hypothetical protein
MCASTREILLAVKLVLLLVLVLVLLSSLPAAVVSPLVSLTQCHWPLLLPDPLLPEGPWE